MSLLQQSAQSLSEGWWEGTHKGMQRGTCGSGTQRVPGRSHKGMQGTHKGMPLRVYFRRPL